MTTVQTILAVAGVYFLTKAWLDFMWDLGQKIAARMRAKRASKFQPVMSDDEADDAWIEAAIFNGNQLGCMTNDAIKRLQDRGLITVTIGLTFKGAVYYGEKVR